MFLSSERSLALSLWRTAVLILPLLRCTNCFNVAPKAAKVFRPSIDSNDSYFGYSVGIVYNEAIRDYFLVVGAPKGNTATDPSINQPGAIFKCKVNLDDGDEECNEVSLDISAYKDISRRGITIHNLRDNAWNGAALDVTSDETTVVCAPRWRSEGTQLSRLSMNGYCSFIDSRLENRTFSHIYPLSDREYQTYPLHGRRVYYFNFGQVGMSVHVSHEKKDELVLGAPGVFNWQGSVVKMLKKTSSRSDEVTYHSTTTFKNPTIPNPFYTGDYGDFSSFGYSTTTGHFQERFGGRKLMYIAGAPRSRGLYGEVFIFHQLPFSGRNVERPLEILYSRKGFQIGEYFGAAVAAPDLNGDGLSDLAVGAPHHSRRGQMEIGCVYVFFHNKERKLSQEPVILEGDGRPKSRFGSAIAPPNDLDLDGYEDLLVGAPYEEVEGGSGAVYVFMGHQFGIRQKHIQKLTASSVSGIPLKGFGVSFSRLRDVDGNKFPDVAIGSYQSRHVALMLTRPVISLSGYLQAIPKSVSLETKNFLVKACIKPLDVASPVESIIVHVTLRQGAGEVETHVYFNETGSNDYMKPIRPSSKEECIDLPVEIKVEDNTANPVKIEMKLDIPTDDSPGPKTPIVDPYSDAQKSSTMVSFVTGCEEDGDEKCSSDLLTLMEFKGIPYGTKILIGEKDKMTLKVKVSNSGEPAFLPKIAITVDSSVDFLPWKHDCERRRQNNSIVLSCELKNPLTRAETDSVEIDFDLSKLTDRSHSLIIKANASSAEDDVNPSDNEVVRTIKTEGKASISLLTWSTPEHVLIKRVDEHTVERNMFVNISHRSSIFKKGITPISTVKLQLLLPEMYLTRENKWKKFVTLNTTEVIIDNKVYNCFHGPLDRHEENPSSTTEADLDAYPLSTIDCSTSKVIKCSKIVCLVGPWKKSLVTGTLTVVFSMAYSELSYVISVINGVKFVSALTASFDSIPKDLKVEGATTTFSSITTHLTPQPLAEPLGWWVYLASMLGGLLLILLISYGLYKFGFFRREKKEKRQALQTHQANIVSAEDNNLENKA